MDKDNKVTCRRITFNGVKYIKGEIIPVEIVNEMIKHPVYERHKQRGIPFKYISELGYVNFDEEHSCGAIFQDMEIKYIVVQEEV